MYNTQQKLFTELYTHDSFPSRKLTNHPSPDDNFFRSRCTPLASLELTISVYQYDIRSIYTRSQGSSTIQISSLLCSQVLLYLIIGLPCGTTKSLFSIVQRQIHQTHAHQYDKGLSKSHDMPEPSSLIVSETSSAFTGIYLQPLSLLSYQRKGDQIRQFY